jgi:very-short-patch-repair endonuclease
MVSPLDKIAGYLNTRAQDWLAETHADMIANKVSPIEATFFLAIQAVLKDEQYFRTQLREAEASHICGIEPQKPVEKFIVDFVISVINERSGKRHLLAVECDGHDFHERTKEQARKDRSRDRRLQELGYTVYRFTGSEIHRDPIKCAETVHDWLHACSWTKT